MMNRRALLSFGLVGSLLLVACSGDDSPSRANAVAAITAQSVPARYATFAAEASELEAGADAWCLDGEGAELLGQVTATRLAWVSVQPFWFGPVMDRRSRFIVDPTVSLDDINEILDAGEMIDATALRELYGADQRGLAAIETLVEIAGGSAPDGNVCTYTRAAAALVADEAAELAAAWQEAGPTFGADDAAANAAIESMVNEVLFGIVTVANDPAVDVARAKLAGMRWAILGDPTLSAGNIEGISGLLDIDVVDQLTAEFDAAEGLDADAVRDLELTITTSVVSALGLSVQFSDADGDG